MYTHTRVYINVYEYIYIDIHMYIYIHIHVHLYTHTCTHIYIRMHMHTYAQIKDPGNNASTCKQYHRRTYASIYKCTHIHICIKYTYVHNLQRVCSQMCTLV